MDNGNGRYMTWSGFGKFVVPVLVIVAGGMWLAAIEYTSRLIDSRISAHSSLGAHPNAEKRLDKIEDSLALRKERFDSIDTKLGEISARLRQLGRREAP